MGMGLLLRYSVCYCLIAALALWAGMALQTPVVAAPAAFSHPGLLNSKEELDFVKEKLKAGAQPWKSAYDYMLKGIVRSGKSTTPVSSLSWQPKPCQEIKAGANSNDPNSCRYDFIYDCAAVYSHSLQWYLKGDKANADKAIAIIDAWSGKLKTFSGADAKLTAAWMPAMLYGAEILRHGGAGWKSESVAAFEKMLVEAVWPQIKDGSGNNGNWEASMISTMIAIAIFTEDKARFDHALGYFNKRLASYISAGGKSQETCRDMPHTHMGMIGLAVTAEMAWKQGLDLWSALDNRILQGAEFHAKYILGEKVPSTLCGGTLKELNSPSEVWPLYELVLHHYQERQGIAAPKTEDLAKKRRPEGYMFFYGWGTLTHSGVPTGKPVALASPRSSHRSLTARVAHRVRNGGFPLFGGTGIEAADALGRLELLPLSAQ